MYKILFVSALNTELKVVKQEIKKISQKEFDIDFFAHWVGNYSTILQLTKTLSQKKYDFVINIWVCGYKTPPNLPLSGEGKYIPEKVIQVAHSYNLANKKEIIYPIVLEFAALKSISCSEIPVFEPKVLWEYNFVDMESYGFEKVCESFKVARISLKVPVDKVWEETKNFDISYAQWLLEKNIDYEKLLTKINKYLEKLPKKYNPEKYSELFSFTFSEKIIFEKWYYKFVSLFVWEDFEDFFQENKHLEKKKFLEALKNKLSEYKI